MIGRHAFVTGASGFIGANLTRALLARGCDVTVLLRPSSDPWRLHDVLDRITVRMGQLEDRASLASIPLDDLRDLVFHAAAAGIRPGDQAAEVADANVAGTANLLDAIDLAGGCSRLVFCSSCSVYGAVADAVETAPLQGDSPYAMSKIAGEAMVREYSDEGLIPAVILRLFTPYGPYEASYRLVAGTIVAARDRDEIPLTGGRQKRDLIFIDDAVEAIIAAAVCDGVEGEILNVSSGTATSVRETVETILEITGSHARPNFGALPYRDNELWELSGNPARMQARLGIPTPRPLQDGLRETARWFEGNAARYREYM